MSESLDLFLGRNSPIMMEKPNSYFDWELQFRKKKGERKRKRINSLGLYPHDFKKFMNEWKKKNIPIKKDKKE